jgi:hypothetical protein
MKNPVISVNRLPEYMLIWLEYPWQVAPQQSLFPFLPALKSKKSNSD